MLVLLSTSTIKAGTAMVLALDASDAPRKILHVKETLTLPSGPVTLFYPKWIPGEHGPTGPVADLVGLHIHAAGSELEWRRDLEDMYAIHSTLPAGASELSIDFDFVLPPVMGGFSAGASSTSSLVVISWNQVLLYPRNEQPDSILVTPTLTLPAGWKFGTALEPESTQGAVTHFKQISVTMLIDSPVLAGEHFRRIDVSPGLSPSHVIDLASDGEAALAMPDEMVRHYRNLVREALALFGAYHYRHYDFLFTLSDEVAHFGLEHHQSSDDRVGERALLDANLQKRTSALLCHEFVHSWNGKFRRPAGLATGNYSSPMHGDLLWVYEGLTEYLGNLLAARSGLRTPEEYRENLAFVAAGLDYRPGRTWRPLQDAADDAQILYASRADWDSYRRSVDFYDEGDLLWLEIDMRIRDLTHGKRSLNDFCRTFHGGENNGPEVKPYTFDDIVSALNATAPYDWKSLLEERLRSTGPHAPMAGIGMGGWKLVYREKPNSMEEARESTDKVVHFDYSVGMRLGEDGAVGDVLPGSAAYAAGISPGMKIAGVNSRKFSLQVFRDALRKGKSSKASLDLLVLDGEYFKHCSVDYHEGERYPYLERDTSKPDLLSKVLAPLAENSSPR